MQWYNHTHLEVCSVFITRLTLIIKAFSHSGNLPMSLTLESYADLLEIARTETTPQRVLFVFTRAEIEYDANEVQKDSFDKGIGGLLKPVMCVDKPIDELTTFEDLVAESDKTEQSWSVMFAACLSGSNGTMPSSEDANKPLDSMIAAINNGMVSQYLAFNRNGELLSLEMS
jgi:hypothetical protein